jgi:hypothetical protein
MKNKLHIYRREGHTKAEEVYYKTIFDLYKNIISTDKFKKNNLKYSSRKIK